MVDGGTYGVGVVLLTKVLCVMQPDRLLALLPYESSNGKGEQGIGRVVFWLDMPSSDSTGSSIGRLASWSNDLLRDALHALPGQPPWTWSTPRSSFGGLLPAAGLAVALQRPAERPERQGHGDGRP